MKYKNNKEFPCFFNNFALSPESNFPSFLLRNYGAAHKTYTMHHYADILQKYRFKLLLWEIRFPEKEENVKVDKMEDWETRLQNIKYPSFFIAL